MDRNLEDLTPERVRSLELEELPALAEQIRRFLLETISKTGGHIGANLGTVELTLALHYVFESPRDKIIWDTGHQGYTHKIVTGRAGLFPTLNQYGGMNRFVSAAESEHDPIEASHGGTSLSIALGMALGMKISGAPGLVVAIIGDGSLGEGLALEALNHASAEKSPLIIVLNDNGYSISPGFGAIHQYLQSRIPMALDEDLFTALDYEYQGPIDGHSSEELVHALRRAKARTEADSQTEPRRVPLLHVRTIKGAGLPAADRHPYRMHFSFPFDPETGRALQAPTAPSYQDLAAEVIGTEMERDAKIVAITPSTLYATALQPVFDRFPERCFDPGMAEQHAMTLAVGLALQGLKPIVFFQSTFMQRAFDQLIHDVCFSNRPILILAVRSGFSGYDNPTHHGIYDFPYMRGLPQLRMLYPKDGFELKRMVQDNLRKLAGPTWIGMPYGPAEEIDDSIGEETPEQFGRPQKVVSGKELMILTVGHKFRAALEACQQLQDEGIDCGLINLRCLKPLPEESLLETVGAVTRWVSVEESVLEGGIGSALAALILDRNLGFELLRIGLPCSFIEPGSNQELERAYGLDTAGIVEKIRRRWFTSRI